jgi:RNA polymerase sigma factor (sigma-70 family)
MLSRILSERPRENHKHSIEKPASGHPRRVYTMGQLTRNEVFTLAVQRYSDTVYRTAVHNCRCTADAEDVVQDVFEKLLHYNGIFESEEHLKAWLLRVAINRCRDLTRAARQKDTELDENLPAPDVLQEDGSVLDAIRTLPENYRNAIYLHYYEGYTAAEIGRMMAVPTNTVLSWLRRARAQLHTMLKEEIEDEVV